jgi:hypothetical protein
MFVAHISQCTQSMLNNEPCFLEDPAWTEMLMQCAAPEDVFSDQSSLALEMLTIKYRIPRLTKRTNHAVVTQVSDLDSLISDLQDVRLSIMAWRRKFNTALITAPDRSQTNSEDFAKRYELLGISLIVNVMASRMLVAVESNGRAYVEAEVQNCAQELKCLQSAMHQNERSKFFLTLKGAFGDAAIATHAYFDEVKDSGKIVEAWRLEKFFAAIGRKCCDGETCCEAYLAR